MARERLYEHRFHFMGSRRLDQHVRALATELGTTCADVMREALAVGLEALQGGAKPAHPMVLVDQDLVAEADFVLHQLLDFGKVLDRLDPDAISALADLSRSLEALEVRIEEGAM